MVIQDRLQIGKSAGQNIQPCGLGVRSALGLFQGFFQHLFPLAKQMHEGPKTAEDGQTNQNDDKLQEIHKIHLNLESNWKQFKVKAKNI
jgi:hypothetical protein